MSHLLVVDDEQVFLLQIQKILQDGGHHVVTARDGEYALKRLREAKFDLVITDIRMPRMDGIQLQSEICSHFPQVPVIVMSGHGTIDLAVSAMKGGAADFLVKPFSGEHLSMVVEKTLRMGRIEEENRILRNQMEKRLSFHNLLGKNFQMQNIYKTLSIVSPTDSTVLILGETGTGKGLLAHAIHHHSHRKEKPFVKVDCGALSETLLESELFGHEKGAFTHAYQRRMGRFEYAHGGTVFLDEIGNISMSLQMKLLRVLEEKKFERVGSNKTIEVDVRVIAATNLDLEEEVRQGKFRSDLFYRLNVVQIQVPPLRERTDDIPLLVDHFLEEFGKKLGRNVPRVSPRALQPLMDYPWPGNVRELENVIEKALLFQTGEVIELIELSNVRETMDQKNGKAYLQIPFKDIKRKVIEDFEKGYFTHLLEWAGGNISQASRKSGMDYKSFYEKIKLYGIDPQAFKRPS